MPWHAHLQLDYRLESSRTACRFKHDGPLRILQSLYPEGDAVCHNVLVHPPGGLVGGDTLDIQLSAAAGSHGLVTTPGATRFYKSAGEVAVQRSVLQVEEGARVEWLPLEAIAYNGCKAHNELRFALAGGAELIGWDVTALGLPNAQQPFAQGTFQQHIEFPGVWLERGRIAAADVRLLDSPLGFAGNRCLASIFFAAGHKLPRERRQQALDLARELIEAHPLRATAGATSPDGQVVVVRALAPLVEPAMDLMRKVWQAWRGHFWGMPAASPRIWST